jgi:hypothetical protein
VKVETGFDFERSKKMSDKQKDQEREVEAEKEPTESEAHAIEQDETHINSEEENGATER